MKGWDGPIAVLDLDVRAIETTESPRPIISDQYRSARVLLRWADRPIGIVDIPVHGGALDAQCLQTAIAERGRDIEREQLRRLLVDADNDDLRASKLSITAAICTRNRPEDLALTLASLLKQSRVAEILVVDNAPSDNRTAELVNTSFPTVRYVREPRQGLDWARNRAIAESTTDILAFIDDDAVADERWLESIVRVFLADSSVGVVTGLVMARELEHEAQADFESMGGFRRGFARKWGIPCPKDGQWLAGHLTGIGDFGVGTNLSFRRSVFDFVGGFDPALDAGTITGGAGDLEMMFRSVKAGWTIVYEPAAIVWHRHRRTRTELAKQLHANGAVFGFLRATKDRFPDEVDAVRFVQRWVVRHHSIRLVKSLVGKADGEKDLVWAEIRGYFDALLHRRYRQSQRQALTRSKAYSTLTTVPLRTMSRPVPVRPADTDSSVVVALRLDEALPDMLSCSFARTVTFELSDCHGVPKGTVRIANQHHDLSKEQIADAVTDWLIPR